MMRFFAVTSLLLLTLVARAAMTPEQVASLPAPSSRAVDFSKDVKPILEASCTKCHAKGKDKGGFVLNTRETLLKGGDSGPAVVPGKSEASYLIELVAAVDPDNVMPVKGSKLTAEQVGVLRAWIDQGVKWDDGVSFAKQPARNLFPRTPEIPRNGKSHPIDAFLESYYRAHKTTPVKIVDDRTYLRRVYLDAIGLLPTPMETEEFLNDKRTDKRARLARALLQDNRRYAEHWLSFWNDLLRNDYKGTGYIDSGRKQITHWLFSALSTNMPFDRFVGQLVNPVPASEGFAKGIVWRGVVNSSQTPEMQAAQNISQVFMGVNLKCASCHDSFINDWTLADAYGFASVYAEGPLEMVECDRPLGKRAPMKFLYAELGEIDAQAPKAERLKQLEGLITSEKNARLTRTIVNRLWGRFLGRGLVEPQDDMEQEAWHPDLLDWLAADLAAHNYDLRHTMERILTSEAYQRPAVGETEQPRDEFVFSGPVVRRMSAEQYIDALATVTGIGQEWPNAQVNLRMAESGPSASIEQGVAARWIWSRAGAEKSAEPGTNYFRKRFQLPAVPTEAHAIITCDNSYKLFVNGKEASSGKDHTKLNFTDILAHLKEGENVIAVSAVNAQAAPDKPEASQQSPAGLFAYIRLRAEQPRRGFVLEKVWDFGTDATWVAAEKRSAGWDKTGFDDAGWQPAAALGPVGVEPWNLAAKLEEMLSNATFYGQIRASLVNNDPLMTAMGRPNREQVVSVRSSLATTLQALELTNGETLAARFKEAAAKLLKETRPETAAVLEEVYTRALQRRPSSREAALALETFGDRPAPEHVEDILWAVSMLPEFQLIY